MSSLNVERPFSEPNLYLGTSAFTDVHFIHFQTVRSESLARYSEIPENLRDWLYVAAQTESAS